MSIARRVFRRLRRASIGSRIVADGSPHSPQFADQALSALLEAYPFETVLDVGSGSGAHTREFLRHGKKVTAVDLSSSRYFQGRQTDYEVIAADYLELSLDRKFDLVWASHVLEHQTDAGRFIRKLFGDAAPGGFVAITVPPLKQSIVGGHVSLWNAGLLLYNIILAHYNCRNAAVHSYGYNISVIVPVEPIAELPPLDRDSGDVERLAAYFPVPVTEGFDGRLQSVNWPRKTT